MKKLAQTLAFALTLTAPVWADEAEENSSAQEEKAVETDSAQGGLDSKETSCTQGSGSQQLVRKVWITYGNDEGHDCKVNYAKETEDPGNNQVLWTAQQDPNYCVEKAQHMVEKLKGWGWDCK